MLDIFAELGFTLVDDSFHDLDIYQKENVMLIVMKKFKDNKKDFRVASNHLDERMIQELSRAFDYCENISGCKSVILTSAHKVAFSRGAKIELLLENTAEKIREFIQEAQALVVKVQNFPKPVIAAVNGLAMGGGLELIMACDYRVSSSRENTVYGLPEAHLGVIPAMGGTQNLPTLVGLEKAKEIISTGYAFITAEEAKSIGLVDYLCPPEELMEKAITIANQEGLQKKSLAILGKLSKTRDEIRDEIKEYLASHPLSDPAKIKVAPLSEAMALFLIEHWKKGAIIDGLAYEGEAFFYLRGTEDCREGIEALIAERPPQFKGR